MSKRLAIRMSQAFFLVIVCFAVIFRAEEPACAGTGIGYDDDDRFVLKARVTRAPSRIVVSKLRPDEQLGNLEIRFIAKRVEPRLPWEGIFLQWHKNDGPGRLWPLISQKSFDRTTGVYRGTWNTATSFTIMDQSGSGVFEKHPWQRLVEFRVNGRILHPKIPVEKTQASRFTPSPALKVETDLNTPATTPAAVPRVITRAPAGTDGRHPSDDYTQKYHHLLQRTRELERAVDSLRKRSYLGFALSALLGGIVAGAGLFLTFFLPRRHPRIGAPASMEFGKLRLRPAYKSQRAG